MLHLFASYIEQFWKANRQMYIVVCRTLELHFFKVGIMTADSWGKIASGTW